LRALRRTDKRSWVNLIGGTKTRTGLQIESQLDTGVYEKGIKISDEDMKALAITYHEDYPRWNYTFTSRTKTGAKPKQSRKRKRT